MSSKGVSEQMQVAAEQITGRCSPDQIMQVGLGFWASKTLLSAIEIGVFTLLAEGPMTLEQVRERTCMHSRSAHDFMDALVALGFLERENGVYRNTPSTDMF